jgi:hypothetical protein
VKNKMTDLRNHLFETIEALKDEEKPMDIPRAKAISEVAQTIINAAKVEVDFYHLAGEGGGEFFETAEGIDIRKRPAIVGGRATGRLGA